MAMANDIDYYIGVLSVFILAVIMIIVLNRQFVD